MQDAQAPAFQLGPAFEVMEPAKIVSVIAWVMFVFWALYTLIAAYHWVRYGQNSSVAIPAIITHIIISLSLALFAVSGFAP
ncbi:MAG: hypothetical protein V4681_03395 [Patescibacteria group bacterium]